MARKTLIAPDLGATIPPREYRDITAPRPKNWSKEWDRLRTEYPRMKVPFPDEVTSPHVPPAVPGK